MRIVFAALFSFLVGCFLFARNNEQRPVQVDRQQMEFLVDLGSGEIVSDITEQRRKQAWIEMMLRGTHPEIAFNQEAYNQFYRRLLIHPDGRIDTVQATTNFRVHQESLEGIKAVDLPRRPLQSFDIDSLFLEIAAMSVGTNAPADSLENVKIFERWPWGRVEKKIFMPLFADSVAQVFIDSLRGVDSIGVDLDGKRITQKRRFRMSLDSVLTRFSLRVTLNVAISSPRVPDKIKVKLIELRDRFGGTAMIDTLIRRSDVDKLFLRALDRARVRWITRLQ